MAGILKCCRATLAFKHLSLILNIVSKKSQISDFGRRPPREVDREDSSSPLSADDEVLSDADTLGSEELFELGIRTLAILLFRDFIFAREFLKLRITK